MNNKALVVVSLSLFLLNGCSDSDEIIGTGVQGLKMPTKIEIIKPKIENDVLASEQNTITAAVFSDTDTDYSNDTATTYIRTEFQNYINFPNLRLCILDKLQLDKMVNKGPYKALVDYNLCANTSSGSNSAELTAGYISVTAISERTDNDSPHTFKAWLSYPMFQFPNASFPPVEIMLGIIEENTSSDKPYGEFTLSSKYVVDDVLNDVGKEMVSIQTRTIASSDEDDGFFKSVNYYNLYQQIRSMAIFLDSDNAENGRALLKEDYNSNLGPASNYLAGQFDVDYLLQEEKRAANNEILHESKICNSRNEYINDVREYGLYHVFDGIFRSREVSAGQRVDLITSKLVEYNNIPAYITQNFYFTFDGKAIPDGATVYDADSASSNPENAKAYGFHFSPGSLSHKNTVDIPLSDLNNKVLMYSGLHPDPLISHTQWLVRVIDNEFQIEMAYEPVDGSYSVSPTIDHDADPSTAEVPVAAPLTFADGAFAYFTEVYIPKSYNYRHMSAVIPSERTITKIEPESLVLPSDPLLSNAPITLYCYMRCPKGGTDQAMVDTATKPEDLYHVWDFTEMPYTYSLSVENHKTILTDLSNNQVVDTYGLNPTPLIDGLALYVRSDKLLTQPLPAPATVQMLNAQNKYFRWMTSNTNSNHLVTLIDSSENEFKYEPWLYITYTHDAVNDRDNPDPYTNPYHGNIFSFHNGYLSGSRNENGLFRPLINLLDGTRMTNEEGNYIIKAKTILQSLQAVPEDQCGYFTEDMFSQQSLAQLLTEEDLIPVNLERSDKPEVQGPPIIIDGAFQ